MKIFYLLALSVLPIVGSAQSKLSYDLTVNTFGVFNRSGEALNTSRGFATFLLDSSGAPVIIRSSGGQVYTAAPAKAPLQYNATVTGGFTIGCKLSYQVYKNMHIGVGAGVSWFKAMRSVQNSSSIITGSFTGIGLSSTGTWDSSWRVAPGVYSFSNGLESEDEFKFVTLNVPVSLSYTLSKWTLELGIVSSFIMSSKISQTKPEYNEEITIVMQHSSSPYDPQPSIENVIKNFFALSITPQYQLNKKVKIGIEYNHALTNSYNTNWYSSHLYPGMKTSSLGLKILYKLK
jgi:hypothetical protein